MVKTDSILESNFGVIKYRVRFVKIECRRTRFGEPNGAADIDDIELWGLAVYTAKQIKANPNWLLTEEGYLICGRTDKDVPTIEAVLDVGRNLNYFSEAAFHIARNGIRQNSPLSMVSVPGLPDFRFNGL